MTTVEEPARRSPFIEEIAVHNKAAFDLETEVDLFAAQLSAQLRAPASRPPWTSSPVMAGCTYLATRSSDTVGFNSLGTQSCGFEVSGATHLAQEQLVGRD